MRVSKDELKKFKKIVEKLSGVEKDEALAFLLASIFEIRRAFLKLPHKKEPKEVEDTFSVGPAWLNFTKKIKHETKK